MKAVHAVLLAAGEGRRFGGPKLLEPFEGEPFVRRAARHAVAAAGSLSVVTGAHADAVEGVLEGLPVRIVRNPQWADGMGSSIRRGMRDLAFASPACDAVLMCLGDQPLVDTASLRRLIEASQRQPQHVIAAAYAGTVGVPCLFPREHFTLLMNLPAASGAKNLLRQQAERVVAIELPEAAVDIDTVDDYAALLARSRPHAV